MPFVSFRTTIRSPVLESIDKLEYYKLIQYYYTKVCVCVYVCHQGGTKYETSQRRCSS